MDSDEIKELARTIARETVRETFLRLGLAITADEDTLQVQSDMAWLRKQRKATERFADWIRKGMITTAVSGLAYILWEGFKLAVSR